MTNLLDYSRRYARQIALPEMGEAGQRKLAAVKVLVVGAGGLGAPLMTYLASAGIGHLGIIDGDRVELSNLPRQIIHESGDIGRLKVESARDRVAELNPDCDVTLYPFTLDAANAPDIIAGYDVVADGSDNFATRFLVNSLCVARCVPLVSAAVSGFAGQVMTVAPHLAAEAGCYQCIVHPDAADERTCNMGILAPFAGVVGCEQALEVARVILGFPALLNHMLVFDGVRATQRRIARARDAACPICG